MSTTIDDRAIELVENFLEFHGLSTTSAAFKAEVKQTEVQRKALLAKGLTRSAEDVIEEMMISFHEGDRLRFFLLWGRNLPEQVRDTPEARRLEFQLQLRFAVRPAQKRGEDPSWHMDQFKNYLGGRGTLLAQDSDLMPYFALPFVPNPGGNVVFRKIYQDEWLKTFAAEVRKFLSSYVHLLEPPELYEVISKADSVESVMGADRLDPTYRRKIVAQLMDLTTNCLATIRRHADMRVYGAGVDLSDLSAKMEVLDSLATELDLPKPNIHLHHHHHPHATPKQRNTPGGQHPFVSPAVTPLRITGGGQSGSGLASAAAFSAAMASASGLSVSAGGPVAFAQVLDYDRIRRDLREAPSVRKCVLLQALRWRLLQCETIGQRRKVLRQYIHHDLCGCLEGGNSNNNNGTGMGFDGNSTLGNTGYNVSSPSSGGGGGGGTPILELLIRSIHPVVREQTARLLNAMASESSGRTYLLEHPTLIQTLVEQLVQEREDSVTRQHWLGTLQKFSLRASAQNIMIDLDVIRWLTTQLRDVDRLSDYTIEYATALLMNLSLRVSGKDRCQAPELRILEVLSELLEHENVQVRTYVNGTMYSLLTRPVLKEKAREMGIEEVLICLMQVSDESIARQINFILEQLDAEPPMEEDEEVDEDEDSEEDAFDDDAEVEAEDEVDDSIPGAEGQDLGESLLGRHYAAVSARRTTPEGPAPPIVPAPPSTLRSSISGNNPWQNLQGAGSLRPVTPASRPLSSSGPLKAVSTSPLRSRPSGESQSQQQQHNPPKSTSPTFQKSEKSPPQYAVGNLALARRPPSASRPPSSGGIAHSNPQPSSSSSRPESASSRPDSASRLRASAAAGSVRFANGQRASHGSATDVSPVTGANNNSSFLSDSLSESQVFVAGFTSRDRVPRTPSGK